MPVSLFFFFFFFNDTATTEIYTLSLHDALPISPQLIPPQTMVLEVSTLVIVIGSVFCPDANVAVPFCTDLIPAPWAWFPEIKTKPIKIIKNILWGLKLLIFFYFFYFSTVIFL